MVLVWNSTPCVIIPKVIWFGPYEKDIRFGVYSMMRMCAPVLLLSLHFIYVICFDSANTHDCDCNIVTYISERKKKKRWFMNKLYDKISKQKRLISETCVHRDVKSLLWHSATRSAHFYPLSFKEKESNIAKCIPSVWCVDLGSFLFWSGWLLSALKRNVRYEIIPNLNLGPILSLNIFYHNDLPKYTPLIACML